jgi:hypothetical protein
VRDGRTASCSLRQMPIRRSCRPWRDSTILMTRFPQPRRLSGLGYCQQNHVFARAIVQNASCAITSLRQGYGSAGEQEKSPITPLLITPSLHRHRFQPSTFPQSEIRNPQSIRTATASSPKTSSPSPTRSSICRACRRGCRATSPIPRARRRPDAFRPGVLRQPRPRSDR